MSMIDGIDVWGECGEFSFSARAWRHVLTLGHWYGWDPVGTEPPKPEFFNDWSGHPAPWDGHYFPADGQRMTSADARALGEALERALLDIPEPDALTGKVVPRRAVRDDNVCRLWGREAVPGLAISPVEEFSGANKAVLRGFITHCRTCTEFWLC